MELIVISGTSGAGKSIALRALEDHGFYCIDNLPLVLLPPFIHHLRESHSDYRRAAIGVDIRTLTGSLTALSPLLEQLRLDTQITVIFMDARDEVLIKRYSESRRRHPLSSDTRALDEAIAEERLLLRPIAEIANHQIDTSHTSIYQLRQMVIKAAGQSDGQRMAVQFYSFGFKYGVPQEADFVFDVRCLPNPHWENRLRSLTGRDAAVCDYLNQKPEVEAMFHDLAAFIGSWLPRFAHDNRSYLTLAIGCTGGQHRSVYLAERLAAHFRDTPYPIQLRHRELGDPT